MFRSAGETVPVLEARFEPGRRHAPDGGEGKITVTVRDFGATLVAGGKNGGAGGPVGFALEYTYHPKMPYVGGAFFARA